MVFTAGKSHWDREKLEEFETDSSDGDVLDAETREAQDAQDEKTLDDACRVVWEHFCRLPTPSYPSFHFVGGQRAYEGFWRRLTDKHDQLLEHFKNNIRRDWNADTGDLLLRLKPTFTHDYVEFEIKLEVIEEFKRMAQEYPALSPICDRIKQGGHAEIKSYSADDGKRASHWEKSPDGQWHYLDNETILDKHLDEQGDGRRQELETGTTYNNRAN